MGHRIPQVCRPTRSAVTRFAYFGSHNSLRHEDKPQPISVAGGVPSVWSERSRDHPAFHRQQPQFGVSGIETALHHAIGRHLVPYHAMFPLLRCEVPLGAGAGGASL